MAVSLVCLLYIYCLYRVWGMVVGGGGAAGGVAILLGVLHANETGISSSRGLGLWLVCAFTFLPLQAL